MPFKVFAAALRLALVFNKSTITLLCKSFVNGFDSALVMALVLAMVLAMALKGVFAKAL